MKSELISETWKIFNGDRRGFVLMEYLTYFVWLGSTDEDRAQFGSQLFDFVYFVRKSMTHDVITEIDLKNLSISFVKFVISSAKRWVTAGGDAFVAAKITSAASW